MTPNISCFRCGHSQLTSPESHAEWDEITCDACGDFIDTYGHWQATQSPSYLSQTLTRSRTLMMQMSRTANVGSAESIGQ